MKFKTLLLSISAAWLVSAEQHSTAPPPPPATQPFRGGAVKTRAPRRGGGTFPSLGQADSLAQFNADVTTVLKDLRGNKNDPTMKRMFHSRLRPTFAVTWTHKMWEQNSSRWRFVVQFVFWYQSALLKRVLPQLTALLGWTAMVLYFFETNKEWPLSNIKFPMTSLSLVSGFVASLLALRTNQGMSRLLEGRMAFGKVVLYTRDMASMVSNFIYDKDPQLALKLARHLATFSWLLKNFLRGTKASGGKDEDLIRTMLPTPADADYILRQRKMPVAVVMRLRQALAHCTHKHLLSTAEEIAIDHTISAMDLAIMTTERIIASPIPPLFTTHAGRLMCFYLLFLPLALYGSGSMNKVGLFLTVGIVGYAMLGLDELSHMMEQPFKVSPLFHLCKNSMNDVADAFCLRPPALDARGNAPYVPAVEPTYHSDEEGFE
eukprot:CAMPEP_0168747996 /NCGR_PEP_ID=MMETSP0724-20121128/15947_1 /TAXON_ID=265536 /ORGANISM="Amphiprora sp., Strain CCMP467" /LENGTH=432 /DNA_ID=CAMNT_0008795809 /DNA_START=103 /DNA_END=1401 /DNA_ORIENTATION=-